jgi:MFS transporter, UMF1 family
MTLDDDRPHNPYPRSRQIAWILYDWANSGFGMIGIGVVFSSYFANSLAPTHLIDGVEQRGIYFGSHLIPADGVFAILTAIAAFLIVCTAPVLGAIADVKGWTKRLFIIHATLGSIVAMCMGFLQDGQWLLGAFLYILSSFFFGTAWSFYNAFLPLLASPQKQGRLSGFGFGAGYIGGALAVIVGVFALKPYLGVQGVLFIGGVWWLLFSLPAFFLLPTNAPDASPRLASSLVAEGFKRVGRTFANVRNFGMLFLFLCAFLIFSNGIDTIINVAPAWTTEVFKTTTEKTTMIFLIVQFVAMPGAILCGYLSDRIGNKPVIIGTLFVWCILSAVTPWIPSVAVFTIVACLLGLVLGGVQSSSRALMAKLAPASIRNEAFGFFSLAGKAVSIFGPLAYAAITSSLGSKWGVAAVLPFLAIGLVVMFFVKEPTHHDAT